MAENIEIINIVYAFAGGVLPALIWLWFWLEEDRDKPEPTKMIALTFVVGGLSVFLAFALQSIFFHLTDNNPASMLSAANLSWAFFLLIFPIFLFMSFAEEIAKFTAVWFTALRSQFNDEPIDPMIYMITGALGFVAFENSLFIFTSIMNDSYYLDFITTGNLRFLGASVVHVVSSALIGFTISATYYASKKTKVLTIASGFILATVLHAVFNFLIITEREIGILGIFALWWFIAVVVMLLFEQVKNNKHIINK